MALRRRRGMTLVEVLVSLALGFGLLMMLWSSMSSSTARFKSGEAGLEAILEAQRTLEYLRQDIAGPFPWTPCNYPEEEIRAHRLGSSRVDFAVRPRQVGHWFDYYSQHQGPNRPKTRHEAVVQRTHDPLAPCKVVWDPLLSAWLPHLPTPSQEVLRDTVSTPHIIEAVPADKGGGRPAVWILGPAVWVHKPETGELLRFTAEDGWVAFGKQRVKDVVMLPVYETSYDLVTDPPPTHEVVQAHKELLAVRLVFSRDEGREDLEVLQVLAKR